MEQLSSATSRSQLDLQNSQPVIAMPITYREDLYQHQGLAPPKTWEEWRDTGKQIRATSGHKSGFALSQTEDANITLYAILWSYGASTVDKERQVTINSPQTRRAMDYVKDLYESCMSNEVLSWDDSSNNQAFLGGSYAWVHNAVGIYYIAREKVPDIFKVTNHTLTPAGPAGQHGTAIPFSQRPPAKPEACKRWNRSKRLML